jgi:hypothetical protein
MLIMVLTLLQSEVCVHANDRTGARPITFYGIMGFVADGAILATKPEIFRFCFSRAQSFTIDDLAVVNRDGPSVSSRQFLVTAQKGPFVGSRLFQDHSLLPLRIGILLGGLVAHLIFCSDSDANRPSLEQALRHLL